MIINCIVSIIQRYFQQVTCTENAVWIVNYKSIAPVILEKMK